MPGSATPGTSEVEYRALITARLPRPIRSAAESDAVQSQMDALLDKPTLSGAEEDYLDLLGSLMYAWEEEHVPIAPSSGVELIRFLLEMRDLPDRALVPIFGSASVVSEVLSGKRRLQAKHIERLAEFFHVSPAVFFPLEPPSTSTRHAAGLASR